MDVFLHAASYLGTVPYWQALFAGVFLSIIVGLIPGVGSVLVMAILLPFIVLNIDDAAVALVMLAAIGGTNNTLDSIPAVVVGVPSGATQVTFLEGHQLARRGKAAHTLGAIYAVSAIGGVVGAVALALAIPIVKPFILSIDRSEIAVIAMFGIIMVAVLSRGAAIRGITAGLLGVLVATAGVDPFTGARRFTFGQIELWEGLPLVAVVTGIFAIPELVDLTMTRRPVAPPGGGLISRSEMFQGALYGVKRWKETIRQSLFGVFLGAIPGVGSGVIDWLSYAFGILFRKDRSEFGKGSLDGVLFAESAQNSKEGGQALPTLTLGIPGGTGWVMILAAMLMYGISPGPPMVGQYAHITMLVVITLAVGNLLVTIIGLVASAPLIRLTSIPYPAISAVIIPLVFLAAFMDMRSWLAIPILLVFTVVGLLMKRFGWPRPPFILGFILGPIIDVNIQTAFALHGVIGVFTRPLTIGLLVLVVLTSALLTRFMARAEQSSKADEEAKPMSEPPGAVSRWRPGPPVVRAENMVPLLLIAGGVLAFSTSMEFPTKAGRLPAAMSLGILLLSGLELFRQVFLVRPAAGQIMDLGMRSSGMKGAARAGFLLADLFVLFLVLAMLIRLDNAAIAFAVLVPLVFMSGKQRWTAAVVTGAILALWTYGFMSHFMAVIWPEPVLADWLLSRL